MRWDQFNLPPLCMTTNLQPPFDTKWECTTCKKCSASDICDIILLFFLLSLLPFPSHSDKISMGISYSLSLSSYKFVFLPSVQGIKTMVFMNSLQSSFVTPTYINSAAEAFWHGQRKWPTQQDFGGTAYSYCSVTLSFCISIVREGIQHTLQEVQREVNEGVIFYPRWSSN